MSEIKLLPCPFCGGEAKLEQNGNFYWVECKGCYISTDWYRSKEKPIRAWNTRKPMERIVERLEEERCEAGMLSGEYEDYDPYYSGKENAYKDAIDIVKAGGSDE